MKKIIALITATLLILGMSACSTEDKDDSSKAKDAKKSAESSAVESKDSDEESAESTEEPTDSDDVEQVLYDADGVKITYTGITKNTLLSSKRTELNVLVENDTDKDIYVQVRNFSANGHAVNQIFSPRVSAGEKKEDKISIKDDDLKENGIEKFENVEFKFYIFDADDWTDSIETEIITMTNFGDFSLSDDESSEADEDSSAAKTVDASDDSIVGSWKYDSSVFDAVYNFKADGTGTYDLNGQAMKFTYTAEGGKLSFTYEGFDDPMVLDYEIDGDELNVKDSFGNDTIYKKQ